MNVHVTEESGVKKLMCFDTDIVRQIGVPKSMFTYDIEGQFHFGFILFL